LILDLNISGLATQSTACGSVFCYTTEKIIATNEAKSNTFITKKYKHSLEDFSQDGTYKFSHAMSPGSSVAL